MDFSGYLGIALAFNAFFTQNSFEIFTIRYLKLVFSKVYLSIVCLSFYRHTTASYGHMAMQMETSGALLATIAPPVSICGTYMISL